MFHKKVRRQLQREEGKAPTLRTENSQAFVLATLQGLIADLRADQKKTQDLLRASELRAEESARKAELLAREIEEGLLIFDGQGFISLANPAAHTLLGIDVWSRRRFQDLLGAGSGLARRVETGPKTEWLRAANRSSTRVRAARRCTCLLPLLRSPVSRRPGRKSTASSAW